MRPDWDTYFLTMAEAVATRADCRRRRVGAVLVKDHRVISTGYNGAPSKHPGCLDGHCPRGLLSYDEVAAFSDYRSGPGKCIAQHAEANALAYASQEKRGGTMYVTHQPCGECRVNPMGSGVVRAVWPGGSEDYTVYATED